MPDREDRRDKLEESGTAPVGDSGTVTGTAIVPVREKEVDFYGDSILVAQGDDEMVWVPLRPLCDHLGLNWSGARQRVNRDPVLSTAQGVCIIHTPGGDQQMLCLPLDLIPGWLFGVRRITWRWILHIVQRSYGRTSYTAQWHDGMCF